jgi:hypothetical protein
MSEILTYEELSLQKDPPQDLVELLKNFFNNSIPNRTAWNYYFRDTVYKKPWVGILKYKDTTIAHYSQFFIDLKYKDKTIVAGKPELPCISQSFILQCLKEKINYQELNPMGILNQKLLENSTANKLDLQFTWPNEIALNSYKKQGYEIFKIKTQTFYYLFNPNFILTNLRKVTENKLILTALKILLGLGLFYNKQMTLLRNILIRKIKATRTASFDTGAIEEITKNLIKTIGDDKVIPARSAELLNTKYSENRFYKYYLSSKKETGYLIMNVNTRTRVAKISDYIASNSLFYLALPVIIKQLQKEKKIDLLIFRNYSGLANKKPILLTLLSNLIYKSSQTRYLAWKTTDPAYKFDPKKYLVHDYLSDFSIL